MWNHIPILVNYLRLFKTKLHLKLVECLYSTDSHVKHTHRFSRSLKCNYLPIKPCTYSYKLMCFVSDTMMNFCKYTRFRKISIFIETQLNLIIKVLFLLPGNIRDIVQHSFHECQLVWNNLFLFIVVFVFPRTCQQQNLDVKWPTRTWFSGNTNNVLVPEN